MSAPHKIFTVCDDKIRKVQELIQYVSAFVEWTDAKS